MYFLTELVIKGSNLERELKSRANVRARVLERGGSFFCRANYFLSPSLPSKVQYIGQFQKKVVAEDGWMFRVETILW